MIKPCGLQAVNGQKIGLLGGSFNPAHEGHLHIIKLAITHLGLSKVWCLVSPQNPLKPSKGMAPLKQRIKEAQKVLSWPAVIVTDVETNLMTQYSIDTVQALKKCYPGVRFVWFMGADNLVDISRWQQWEMIFRSIPIAVFDRPPYSLSAETSVASRRFSSSRLDAGKARSLVNMKPPAWVYLKTRLHSLSGTQIRAKKVL